MSDYHRGPYTPGAEPPLAFDDRRAPRRGGPAPVTLILSLLLLLAVGGGVFYVYRGGVRGPGQAPQPVGAPVRDVRTAAPAEARTPDPADGLSIYKDNPNAAGAPPAAGPAFVPAPEQPTPRPVAAVPAPAPTASPEPTPLPVTTAAPPTTVKAATSAAKAALKPVPAKSAAKSPTIDKLIADTAEPAPAAKAEPPAKPAIPAKAAAKSGPAVIQIGAFSSQALADSEWNAAAGAAPGVMAGKGKRVTPIVKADGSTLYRTAITGFASRDDAQALCDRLKAAGTSCFVR